MGPLLFSLCLLELLDSMGNQLPKDCQLALSLRHLDGILIGPRAAVRQVLSCILSLGPKFGLHLNLAKCEIYWPSGDQSFAEFPEIIRFGQDHDGFELFGLPMVGSPQFFAEVVGQGALCPRTSVRPGQPASGVSLTSQLFVALQG